nr:hypothetical protein [Enterovirga rhinocerotis]
MRLVQRGEAYSILIGTAELMTNILRGSEQALGRMGCAHLHDTPQATVLIGGLGMGFTLNAALAELPPSARIVVSELMPAVEQWARGPLGHVFGRCLDDPRVEIRIEDVRRTIQSGAEQFDAILLDVDNGPQGMTQRSNNRLYDAWGLKRARFALKPNGVLAVWSGSPNRQFKARLRLCGFDVEERRFHSDGRFNRRHVIWFATKPEHAAW